MKHWPRRTTCALVTGVTLGLSSAALAETGADLRIVGGWEATAGDYPFQAALVTPGRDSFNGQFCGGTLIHPRWVLTASHCFAGENDQVDPYKPIDIVIGRHDLTSQTGVRVATTRAILYPGFTLNTMDGDVALLELAEPVNAPLVKLMGQTVDFRMLTDGSTARAVGWGNMVPGNPSYPTNLMEVNLPLVSEQQCGLFQAGARITQNMICAGYPQGGKDTCQGDSGGPLMQLGAGGEWIQIGVTSFGEGCAEPGKYGVYAKVSNFAYWISNNICAANEIPPKPQVQTHVVGNTATATVSNVPQGGHVRLYYAPHPGMSPIAYQDLYGGTELSVMLPSGSDYYVAAISYNGPCLSPVSDITEVHVN